MPSSKNYVRDYKQEYNNYHAKPEQVNNRSKRNQAHSAYEKKHGDTKADIDHKTPLSKGGTNSGSNLRATSKGSNRSFARTSTGAVKSQLSARENNKRR